MSGIGCEQCDQKARIFLKYLAIKSMNLCPKVQKLGQSGFKILQKTVETIEKCQTLIYFLYQKGKILPNLVDSQRHPRSMDQIPSIILA